MTKEEKTEMMSEIMEVVERHIAKSKEKEVPKYSNKYGREYGISDEEMSKWKEEYRKMRVDTKTVLEEVKRNPIDTSSLISSFDIDLQTTLLK
jgi:hypothetical protein